MPGRVSFKLSRPPSCALHINLVADFIDQAGCQWNRSFILCLLSPTHTRAILAVPFLLVGTSASLIWHYEKYESYFVGFGNSFASSSFVICQPFCCIFSIGNTISFLLEIYLVFVSSLEVKYFLWRLLHNALPVLGNLAHRGMALSSQCPLCHTSPESIGHALFWCPHALATCFLSTCGYKPNAISFLGFPHCATLKLFWS